MIVFAVNVRHNLVKYQNASLIPCNGTRYSNLICGWLYRVVTLGASKVGVVDNWLDDPVPVENAGDHRVT